MIFCCFIILKFCCEKFHPSRFSFSTLVRKECIYEILLRNGRRAINVKCIVFFLRKHIFFKEQQKGEVQTVFTTNHYYNRHRTIKSMLFSMQPHHHTCVVYFFLSYRCCSLKIFTVNRLKGKLRRCLACLTAVRTYSKKISNVPNTKQGTFSNDFLLLQNSETLL